MSTFQSARNHSDRAVGRPNHNEHGSVTPGHAPGGWHYDEAQDHTNSAPPGYYGVPCDPNMLSMNMGSPAYTDPRSRADSMMSERRVPLTSVAPGPVWPSEAQLNTAYGYAIQRQDGSFTRLLRADELRDVKGAIPEYQGPEGLIILPEPRQPSPTRRQGSVPMIPYDIVASLPLNRHYPQSRQRPGLYDETQHHIDTIIAQSSSISPPPPFRVFRREKIYCDKWIHEGVCAFTQMGCKYKHEMPMDKQTQMSLGLNHGIPNWYRRAYSVQLHSPPPPPPPSAALHSPVNPSNPARLSGNWRRCNGRPASSGSSPVTAGMASGPSGVKNSYGPIGPPTSQTKLAYHNSNPYSPLKVEENNNNEGDEDDEDDTVTYRGRRH